MSAAPPLPPSDGQELEGAARSGAVWSTIAFVATRGLSFIAILILARLLAPSEFGLVAAVLVVLGVLELGSDLGMKASVIYEQEPGITPRVQTAFSLGMVISLTITAAGVLLAPLVGDFFKLDEVTGLFRLAVLNITLTGLGNVHDALLLRDMAFRPRIVTEVVRGLVRAAVSVGLALAGAGAASLVWGMLAGTFAWTATLWWVTRFVPSLRLDLGIARTLLGYGLGASALDALAAVTTRLDAAVIGRVLGDRALGLYSIAFRIPELLIQSVAWNLSLVVFPALSRQRVIDREGLAPATLALVRYQGLYAVPVAAGLAVLAAPLVEVLFGPEWRDAAGVLAAVAAMTAISALVHPLGDLLKAIGRQWVLVALNIALIPAMIAAIVAAASEGIVAVAWARAGSLAVFAACLVVAAWRLARVRPGAVASAVGPALIAGAGVAVGAGAVRLAWPALSAGPLLAGAVAGALTGAAALRILAPAAFRAALAQLKAIRRATGRRPPTEAEAATLR
jgi:lipopolysaccharide exporter